MTKQSHCFIKSISIRFVVYVSVRTLVHNAALFGCKKVNLKKINYMTDAHC